MYSPVKNFVFLFSLFLLLFLGANSASAATINVDITSSDAFDPAEVTINTGDTIIWTSLNDNSQVSSDKHPSHTEYPDPACPNANCFDSPVLDTNDTFSFTFLIGGTWEYHNHQKPGKTGTITINDLNTPETIDHG